LNFNSGVMFADDSGVVPTADDSGVVLRTIATAVIESAATKAAWGMRQ